MSFVNYLKECGNVFEELAMRNTSGKLVVKGFPGTGKTTKAINIAMGLANAMIISGENPNPKVHIHSNECKEKHLSSLVAEAKAHLLVSRPRIDVSFSVYTPDENSFDTVRLALEEQRRDILVVDEPEFWGSNFEAMDIIEHLGRYVNVTIHTQHTHRKTGDIRNC